MTGEQQRYPPPTFSAAADAPAALPWSSSRFEASRDWSWSQSAPAGPWSPNPGQHYQRAGYHQNRGGGQQQWRGGQQQRGKRKQQKEPEFSHFCDTCDRGFKTRDKYDEHVSQHVKCSVTDCRFTAHEKLVKIHWRNNHTPGAKRIKLDTAEDVARWREERRKNYPTLRNVERKLQLEEVKQRRGDVLETAQFGRIRSRGGGRPERDPLAALADSDPESEKDESVQQTQAELTVAPKCVTSALGSLMSSYGDGVTSSESDGDDAVLRASQALEENKTLLHTLPVQRSTAPCEDRPQPSHNAPAGRGRGRGRGRGGGGGRGRGGARSNSDETQRHRPTLLEMLLAPDVRHERNVVLQCVRFVVRSGFFGLAGKDGQEIDVSTDERWDGQTDAGKRESQSVFQQLFAQDLVCDDPEQT